MDQQLQDAVARQILVSDAEKLLSAAGAARLAGVSDEVFRRHFVGHVDGVVRIGSRMFYPPSEVLAAVRRKEIKPRCNVATNIDPAKVRRAIRQEIAGKMASPAQAAGQIVPGKAHT